MKQILLILAACLAAFLFTVIANPFTLPFAAGAFSLLCLLLAGALTPRFTGSFGRRLLRAAATAFPVGLASLIVGYLLGCL